MFNAMLKQYFCRIYGKEIRKYVQIKSNQDRWVYVGWTQCPDELYNDRVEGGMFKNPSKPPKSNIQMCMAAFLCHSFKYATGCNPYFITK